MPLGALVLCSMARRSDNPRCPLQLVACSRPRASRNDHSSVALEHAQHVVLIRIRIWQFCCCCLRHRCRYEKMIDMNVSDILGADQVLTRMAVWGEIALVWGPMIPIIPWAALVTILLEKWCHCIARRKYHVEREVDIIASFRFYLCCGIIASLILCVCDLISSLAMNTNLSAKLNDSLTLGLAIVLGLCVSIGLHLFCNMLNCPEGSRSGAFHQTHASPQMRTSEERTVAADELDEPDEPQASVESFGIGPIVLLNTV